MSLNGQPLCNVWSPNHLLEITGKLKSKNLLLVSLGNEFRNRIIGDLVKFGEVKNVETSANIKDLLKPGIHLKQSGLIGPIEILLEE